MAQIARGIYCVAFVYYDDIIKRFLVQLSKHSTVVLMVKCAIVLLEV